VLRHVRGRSAALTVIKSPRLAQAARGPSRALGQQVAETLAFSGNRRAQHASASPKRSAKPISTSLSTPCSKHSIAQAIVAPQAMVSTPYWLHNWLASATASRLSMPQYEPKVESVSYSGPP
jgi:hypothetical protein